VCVKKIVRGTNVARVSPLGSAPPPAATPAAPQNLKQAVSPVGHGGVISKEAYGAYNEAKEILAVAEREAERIRQEAVQLRDEQVRQGFEEGHRTGYQEALAGLAGLERRFDEICKDLEPQLVELAIGVARKIIGRELGTNPDTIADIVAQALRTVRHQRDITVRVHPDHVDEVTERKHALLGVLSRAPDIQIRADPSVRAGGCVIESELGKVEADLETQLELLRQALSG
jgi:type III secretion system HrpE/YscL family protein